MRIAHFVGSLLEPLGGAEQYALELARWQRDEGHDVTVIVGWISPAVETSLAVEGLGVRLVRSRRPYPPDRKGSKPAAAVFHALDLLGALRAAESVRRALADDWDIVHVHRFAGFGAAVLRGPRPTVMTVHDYGLVDTTTTLLRGGRELPTAPLVQRLRTAVVNRSLGNARLVFSTERLRAKHMQWGLRLPARTAVVPHGWRGAPATTTPPGDRVVFLFLGKLIASKGIDLLLGAWGEGLPGAELWVAGAGELEPAVRDAPGVRFWGWVDDAGRREALAGASALVLPSTWPEIFLLSAAEGVLAGLPIVSTTVASPPVVRDGVNGILSEPDAVSLRSALERLLDPIERERLSRGSRALAADLDFGLHGRRIEALYREVGADRRSVSTSSTTGAHA